MSTARLEVREGGTIDVPAFELPLSAALSPETKAMMALFLGRPPMSIPEANDFDSESAYQSAVDSFRAVLDQAVARPGADRMLARFPVQITPGRMGGVGVEEFVPKEGADAERVLINLHGGAFCSGAIYIGRMESIPMSYRGKFRVISVDYRQGYEHKFPAASEDVATVYQELLRTYAPNQIGIYGGSAGGMLAAQATAWILEQGLPAPGGIGVFGAGTGGRGDGGYFSAIGTGQSPPSDPMADLFEARYGYFSGGRGDDYLRNPNIAPETFRARFPPTLIVTGTRAFDLSPALATHRALTQAGVEASLQVFDGLAHCFYYDAVTPESVDAYNTMIRFFRRYLSRPA